MSVREGYVDLFVLSKSSIRDMRSLDDSNLDGS